MEDVIFTVLDSVRRPYVLPGQLLDHALEILAASTRYSAKVFKVHPRLFAFLVAGLRAKGWDTRWMCFSGLLKIYDKDDDDAPYSVDPAEFLKNISQTLPWHLQRALDAYGPSRSDIRLALTVSEEYDSSMRDRVVHGDLYAFGLKQAELILKADLSVAGGILHGSSTWMNTWRSAINKIRAKNKPEDQDAADILDIAYLLYRRRHEEAVALARKSITRNPEQAYFYYALSFSSDHVERLQAEKKGLKCQQSTPFVRYQLLYQAVEHAGAMGYKWLLAASAEVTHSWEKGIACFVSALEDAKTFVEEAPPDHRSMLHILNWLVLLSLLVREDLSPDLMEIKDIVKKVKTAEQFAEFMGVQPDRFDFYLAQKAALKHYAQGVAEFSRVYEDLDRAKSQQASPTVTQAQTEDALAAWLDDVRLEDGSRAFPSHCEVNRGTKVNFDSVTMYRCSWCGNPSALLKKCELSLLATLCLSC
ncbi:hypothetical protein NLJ89_g10174 [Agrocybe chaxingu]|uniref:Uncharacterized protein n=1 Tax=Agrocybe chaxingu TaxID=84603 RepID=A0A9W8JRT9_9AGAR|nr:hypothetical protein NLJ89_g10174 [Agrocybe chaxingu]